jgi:hypothetical protein
MHQDYIQQIYGENIDALSDHKMQDNFIQYIPGIKVR